MKYRFKKSETIHLGMDFVKQTYINDRIPSLKWIAYTELNSISQAQCKEYIRNNIQIYL